jgi:signal transduction histidine kinase
MESEPLPGPPAAPSLAEVVVRTLRHEVGDLLQTVYATAAILQERLPSDWALERRIVGDLRTRGEACKNLLDTVHDLVCPIQLTREPVNLAETAANLVDTFASRYPRLQVRAESVPAPAITADMRRITQVGTLLLAHACQTARHEVRFRTQPGPARAEVEWLVSDDGPGLTEEELERLRNPFATTRHSLPVLALALAQRIVELHGGRMDANGRPEGGLRIQVVLPAAWDQGPNADGTRAG